ncbi:hypothetical protein [Planctomicrobium piriforme]|uniref:hypothetical protein n=1 Tax=Planctomicrobium piriforme TaxID=1576369 RepID=UPI001587460A|nr:hypothetical protein [Planctomicrobium piriforme]
MGNEIVSALNVVLRKELRFVQKVCQPSPEQLNDIRQAGMVEIQEISKLFAREPEFSVKWPDGRKQLCDALAKKIDAILPEQAAGRYRDELASREKAKQDAVVAMMVSIIDGKVGLTPQQAEQVDAAIRNSWQTEWSQSVAIFQYPRYAPLPDVKTIAKILTPHQLQVFKQTPNHGRLFLGWQAELGVQGWANGLEIDEVDD